MPEMDRRRVADVAHQVPAERKHRMGLYRSRVLALHHGKCNFAICSEWQWILRVIDDAAGLHRFFRALLAQRLGKHGNSRRVFHGHGFVVQTE